MKISSHEMVPTHAIIPREEIPLLLEKYSIKMQQFPKLLDTDPLVLEIGATPGDVVKITRMSATAGESTYYRLVIATSF